MSFVIFNDIQMNCVFIFAKMDKVFSFKKGENTRKIIQTTGMSGKCQGILSALKTGTMFLGNNG